MKRDGRFTTDELNQVISNWEQIAAEYNIEAKLIKVVLDMRSPGYRMINKQNIDHIETVNYRIELKIPFLNNHILITTSEQINPKFTYKTGNYDFSFSISNEDFIDKLLKKIHVFKETQINFPEFDNKYFIDTNDATKLKSFVDDKISNWLQNINLAYFDLNSTKLKENLVLFASFSEFSVDEIRTQIEMFKYCIVKLKSDIK